MKKIVVVLLLLLTVLFAASCDQINVDDIRGPKGEQGEQGPAGERGPEGETGAQGEAGVGIDTMEIDENGNLVVTLTDGSVQDLGPLSSMSVGIEEIRITENKTIAVTLDSGIVFEVLPFDVSFTESVCSVSIGADGEMTTYDALGTPTSYGKIEKTYVNAEYELKIVFENKSEMTLGTVKKNFGEMCAHEYGEFVNVLPATCTSIGYDVSTCSLCSAVKYNFIAAKGHTWDDGTVVKKETETENGVKLYCCTICKGTKMEIIPARPQTVAVSGVLYKSDTDYDATNNAVLAGVRITVSDGETLVVDSTTGEGGEFAFEIRYGTYTVTFEAEGFNKIELSVDTDTFDFSTLNKVYMDIEQSSTIKGTVLQADADLNESNNERLSGATVSLVKQSGTNEISLTQTTLDDGRYEFAELTAGIYTVVVSKDGYISVEQIINVEEGQTVVQNMSLEVIAAPSTPDELGAASGRIFDAAQQGVQGIEGLTLYVREGLNNTTGDVVATLTTEADGTYRIDIKPGHYTVLIVDERNLDDEDGRYVNAYFNVKILAGQEITEQNGTTTNNAEAVDVIQVKLSWGESPSDLDSHLTGPTADGRFHVSYNEKALFNANLDRDDTDSYGPETTTVYLAEGVAGVYRFSVQDYSNREYSESNAMSSSGAKVEVYFGGMLRYTFYVPEGDGTLWTVFEYDSSTGIFTPINSLSYESNPSAVQ